MALTHKSKKSGHRFEIELVGTLDEDSNLNEIKTDGENEIAVSFEKLEAINSCGVR